MVAFSSAWSPMAPSAYIAPRVGSAHATTHTTTPISPAACQPSDDMKIGPFGPGMADARA